MYALIIVIVTWGEGGNVVDTSVSSIGPFQSQKACSDVAYPMKMDKIPNSEQRIRCVSLE